MALFSSCKTGLIFLAAICVIVSGCAQMRNRASKESAYSLAPAFDGTNVVPTDPAAIPPIIRGAAPANFESTITPATSYTTPAIITPSPLVTSAISTNSADRIEQLTRRVSDLERELSSREVTLARKDSEISVLLEAQGVVPPEAIPHSVAKKSAYSEYPERLLPVIPIPDVEVTQKNETIRITIPDAVLFQSGSYQLRSSGEEVLRRVTSEVRACYPTSMLEIEGHSDNIVTNPQNPTQLQEVTCYKASLLMKYMVGQLGIDAQLVRPTGFGGSAPLADNNTEEGRQKNRRFVLVIEH